MNPLFLLGLLGGGIAAYAIVRHEAHRHEADADARRRFGPAARPSSAFGFPLRSEPTMPDPFFPTQGPGREHEALDDATSAGPDAFIPTMSDWARILAPMCLDADIPLPFALKWIKLESGGNPCAVGVPAQHGRGSDPTYTQYPREIGIAQLFSPDDFQALKIKPASFRAYCAPERNGEFPQDVIRPLTLDEIHQQAIAAIGKIQLDRARAQRQLRNIQAGPQWAPDRADFWKVVKLQHGIPGIASSGLPAVTRKLGRPPIDWGEFRRTLANVKLDAGTEAYRSEFNRTLNAAENTASEIVEKGVA